MTSSWPDGWITATLTQAGLPVTDFTRKAMSAWQQSTPMLPYTNNPVGLPAVKNKTLELMRTGYAMFVTMGDFRTAFSGLIGSPAGQALHDALALSERYSEVWRAVAALKLPASQTETDYPSAVLELTSQAYREKVQTVASAADRKTSGQYGSQTAFGAIDGASGRTAASVVSSIQQATRAVNTNLRGMF